jgi:hypothetical protein
LPEKSAALTPEALKENIEYIIHHASGKNLSKEEKREAQHYAQKLKYPEKRISCIVSQTARRFLSAER